MKTSALLFALIALYSNAVGQISAVNGKITNPKGKMVYLKYYSDYITYDETIIDSDSLDANGYFNMDFNWPEAAYITFFHGDEITGLYLIPGSNLNLTLDTEAFDETVRYAGNGEEVNNYLAAKFLASESPTRETYLVKADEFTAQTDAARDKALAMVNALYRNRTHLTDHEKTFLANERNAILYDAALQKLSYPSYHQYLTNNFEYKPDPSYYDFLRDIPVMNYEALGSSKYHEFLKAYVQHEWRLALKAQPDADPNALQKAIIEKHTEGYQREFLYTDMLYQMLNEGSSFAAAETMYVELKPAMTTTSFVKLLDKAFETQRKLAPGQPAPDFVATDLHGKPVQLTDYTGKAVYLDIWATWCGPCIGEIPAMEKLIHAMDGKDVVFLAISVDENENAWRKMIKDKNLQGHHGLSPGNFNASIAKAYQVNGIPRYILIDKEGNIANSNAPRPGQVREELVALLSK